MQFITQLLWSVILLPFALYLFLLTPVGRKFSETRAYAFKILTEETRYSKAAEEKTKELIYSARRYRDTYGPAFLLEHKLTLTASPLRLLFGGSIDTNIVYIGAILAPFLLVEAARYVLADLVGESSFAFSFVNAIFYLLQIAILIIVGSYFAFMHPNKGFGAVQLLAKKDRVIHSVNGVHLQDRDVPHHIAGRYEAVTIEYKHKYWRILAGKSVAVRFVGEGEGVEFYIYECPYWLWKRFKTTDAKNLADSLQSFRELTTRFSENDMF